MAAFPTGLLWARGKSSCQLASARLGQKRSLWGVLRWKTYPRLDIDYAISLRLYNAEGERAYQTDDVLWQPTNHWTTSHWSANEPVDTLHSLDFPVDLLPGDYELRMVVYNFETEVPDCRGWVFGTRNNPGAPAAGGNQVTGDPTEERVKRREKRENPPTPHPFGAGIGSFIFGGR